LWRIRSPGIGRNNFGFLSTDQGLIVFGGWNGVGQSPQTLPS